MNTFVLDMYRQMFASLRRGNIKGVYSNAKPIFLISIIDYITHLKNPNHFIWGDKNFEDIYISNFKIYDSSVPTPLWKPFYYMSSEPFYDLIWQEPPNDKLLRRPSGKLLKGHLSFAKLDDELWDLLQAPENIEYLRNCIINQYLSYKKTDDGNYI